MRAYVIGILLSFLGIFLSLQHLKTPNKILESRIEHLESLYLPRQDSFEYLSLGFRVPLSQLLWFKTLNYVGRNFKGDKNYPWLFSMCKLVGGLDPKAVHVFDFCGNMLAWEAKDPERAIEIISKGIESNPNSWKLLFLRGFTNYFLVQDPTNAQIDFLKVNSMPDTPPGIREFTSKKEVQDGDVISLLMNMLKEEKRETVRSVLIERLKTSFVRRDLKLLTKAIEVFKHKYSKTPLSLDELVSGGVLSSLPKDPNGDAYYLEGETPQSRLTLKR